MRLTNKQRNYIVHAVRTNRLWTRIPSRVEYRTLHNGTKAASNMVYADLSAWLDANVEADDASPIISLFQHGAVEDDPNKIELAFQGLVNLGMPIV